MPITQTISGGTRRPIEFTDENHQRPRVSIVAPAQDEQDNIEPLVERLAHAMREAGISFELIIVNDGSTDQTADRLARLASTRPWLRVLHHEAKRGQSAAMLLGIQSARGRYVATLDADLQNDPAEIPAMLEQLEAQNADMVQGDRSANRRDNLIRRVSSRVGRKARRWLLKDTTRDTGCSLRVMRAELAQQLPLYWRGMHRFIPACIRMFGGVVIEMPVHHRPRHTGQTKYGLGILNRGISGLFDCLAVRWMLRRYCPPAVRELERARSVT